MRHQPPLLSESRKELIDRIAELGGIVNSTNPGFIDALVEGTRPGGNHQELAAQVAEKQSAAFQMLVLLDRLRAIDNLSE